MKYNTGIYQIINKTNSKRYIGSASNLKKRKGNHFDDLKNKNHKNKHLQHSFDKYELENFKFEILLYCDKKDLLFYEQRAIDSYGIENLYNIAAKAGSSLGVFHSEETKKKLSEINSGKNNPNYGIKRSDEWKKAICRTGMKHSEEAKRKLKESRQRVLIRNKKLTPEMVRLIRNSTMISQVELSKIFNVTQAAISSIKSYKNWSKL